MRQESVVDRKELPGAAVSGFKQLIGKALADPSVPLPFFEKEHGAAALRRLDRAFVDRNDAVQFEDRRADPFLPKDRGSLCRFGKEPPVGCKEDLPLAENGKRRVAVKSAVFRRCSLCAARIANGNKSVFNLYR